jgi:hypothetical protein
MGVAEGSTVAVGEEIVGITVAGWSMTAVGVGTGWLGAGVLWAQAARERLATIISEKKIESLCCMGSLPFFFSRRVWM